MQNPRLIPIKSNFLDLNKVQLIDQLVQNFFFRDLGIAGSWGSLVQFAFSRRSTGPGLVLVELVFSLVLMLFILYLIVFLIVCKQNSHFNVNSTVRMGTSDFQHVETVVAVCAR